MGTFWQDFRYGLRTLARSPGFTVVALLTLALGVAANAVIFSIVNAVLLRPPDFPEANQIVLVLHTEERRNLQNGVAAPIELRDFRERSHSFQALEGQANRAYNVIGNGEAEKVLGTQVTTGFLDLLRVKPFLGRSFEPENAVPGHEQVALIGYAFWQRRYGGNRDVIGRSITIDDKPYTIIGVLPAKLPIWGDRVAYDLMLPYAFTKEQLDREYHILTVFGRLKPGVTVARADAEMKSIVNQLHKEYPVDTDESIRVVRLQDYNTNGPLRSALRILLAAVGLVLLIACVNVANLQLSRAATREKEIAVRASLGAGRFRLARQLMTESVALALLGGIAGIVLAYGGFYVLRAILASAFYSIPYIGRVDMDVTVLGFTLAISAIAGIVFGLAPSIQIFRMDLNAGLKEGGRNSGGGRQGYRLRDGLVVSEVALALLLLCGSGLLIRSLNKLLSENMGFNPDHLLIAQIWLPDSRYSDIRKARAFFEQLETQIQAEPGVQAAALVNWIPMGSWRGFVNFAIEGHPPQRKDHELTAQYHVIGSSYFRTMGTRLLRGRDFTPGDGEQTSAVGIINEALAREYWPNEEPIGKRIRILPEERQPFEPQFVSSWITIVGVAENTTEFELGEKSSGIIYLPYEQNPTHLMFAAMRTSSDSAGIAVETRSIVNKLDPGQPIADLVTMNHLIDRAVSGRRLNMWLASVFAGLATILAAIGIYGVISYTVTQQTRDIGIRMALGAQRADIFRIVIGRGMGLVALGSAIGLVAAVVILRKVLSSLLFGVAGADPATLAAVTVLLFIVALAACYFPARRAMRVEPNQALHYE
ncbi:MAG: ABC transporter permease [Candidatus Acidiferrales bacterium]